MHVYLKGSPTMGPNPMEVYIAAALNQLMGMELTAK